MSERSEERELTALESTLRELRPKRDAMDRAVLMYRAGRASARGWVWPTTTLFSTAAALALGVALWIRPAPPVMYVVTPSTGNESVSVIPSAPALAEVPERGAWSRYIHLQEQVVLHGLDGLPPPPSTTDESPLDDKSLLNPF